MIKCIVPFLTVQLIFLPIVTYANDIPKAIVLNQGDKAPFAGLLLNDASQAKMIAEGKEKEKLCKLETDYLSMRGKVDCELKTTTAKIDLDAQKKKYDAVVKIKDDQINSLNKVAIESSKSESNYKWWLAGGVVVGVLISVGTFFAVAEMQKAANR